MGIDVETCVFAQPEIYISIHAPRMGIDVRCLLTRTGKHYFNPRSPDGERLVDFRTVGLRLEISIHAPPGWGATTGWEPCSTGCTYFNPRSPDGERQNRKRRSNQMKDFNPRFPDGERHTRRLCRTLTRNFNPRSPDGERHGLPCGEVASRFISTHAPRMGSDGGGMFLFNRKLRF